MNVSSKSDEAFTTPPPYYIPENNLPLLHLHSPNNPPAPEFQLFTRSITHSAAKYTLPVPHTTVSPAIQPSIFHIPLTPTNSRFVSFESKLHRSPGLTACSSCQLQVTSQVTYRAGKYAWLMCLLFILFGLIFGCCLIPLFVKHFQDACHTCPHCRQVLHVHRKTCCSDS